MAKKTAKKTPAKKKVCKKAKRGIAARRGKGPRTESTGPKKDN